MPYKAVTLSPILLFVHEQRRKIDEFSQTYPMTEKSGVDPLRCDFRACSVGKKVTGMDECPGDAVPSGPVPPPPKTAPKPKPEPKAHSCTITGNNVNYRTCPETSCPAIGEYNKGKTLTFECRKEGESIDGDPYVSDLLFETN